MITKVTVIGGGSTGHATAAYLSLQNLQVTLCDNDSFAPHFNAIKKNDGILLRGKERGIGKVHKVTTCLEEALENSQLIIVAVVAERHEEIAKAITPYLENGQHILISPGNLGSFIFRRAFKESGVNKDVTVSELEGNIFPCRLTGEAEVTVGMPFRQKPIASLPSEDTPRVIEALNGIFDLSPCINVMDAAINSNNFVIHLGTSLLSSALIEHRGMNFNLFQEGLTPSTISVSKVVHKERSAIIKAMGYIEHSNPIAHLERLLDDENNPQLDVFKTLDGPYDLKHRYVSEDALCCGAFALSVAKNLGLKTPMLEAMITIASAVNDTNYYDVGRTLENLGFNNMTMSEILSSI